MSGYTNRYKKVICIKGYWFMHLVCKRGHIRTEKNTLISKGRGYCYDCQKIIHEKSRQRERDTLRRLRNENQSRFNWNSNAN